MINERSLQSYRARKASAKLWQSGTLFHNFRRFPHGDEDGADRLLSVLERGLIAPAHYEDGSVVSDLNITASDTKIAYDSVVFLSLPAKDLRPLHMA